MSSTIDRSLPQPFTTLVGREQDLESIAALLRTQRGSILTLVGPAGVGKTRLAVAVAQTSALAFEHGVAYVDLAPVSDAQQVILAIVTTLGLAEGEGAAGQLARYLSDRELLLVIDNFEQVLDAAPVLNACVAGAPNAAVLVTSQTPLRVWGEREYAVEPLPLPASVAGRTDTAAMLQNPSVQLFATRAQAVRPAFQLTESNLPAVAAICRQLDGLPLAIELAAARSNVLSPEALLSRLEGSLLLLSGGPRDVPDRYRALHAAIEWSYSLLDPKEALLLDRLSVFAGSFSLPAAEAIAGNAPIVFEPSFYLDGIAPLPPDDGRLAWSEVFELLDGLVDHSLVQRVESGDADPRFRLFQTIRKYAASKLAAENDGERTALRHATWYRALAETAWGPDGVALLERIWLEALETDYENLRSALDYISDSDPAVASTFVAALVWFFYIRGRRMEGIRAIERTAGRFDPESISPEARARTQFAYGSLLSLFSQTRQAGVEQLESVLIELISLGHDWGAGYTYMALGVLAEDDGQYERALEYVALGRPLLEAVNDAPTIANVDFHTGVANFGLGHFEEARALATRVAEARPEDAGLNVAYALHLLGLIELAEGNRRGAAAKFRESLDFSLGHGVVATATELIDATATLLAELGDPELVARLFGAADRLNRESGNPITLPEKAYYDAARDQTRDAIGATRFHELLANGATLSLDSALALARQTLEAVESGETRADLHQPPGPSAQPFGLTAREREVLQLVAFGLSDREIGDRLYISHGTARTHVRNILAKLDTHSRSAATSIALREGLVDLSETG